MFFELHSNGPPYTSLHLGLPLGAEQRKRKYTGFEIRSWVRFQGRPAIHVTHSANTSEHPWEPGPDPGTWVSETEALPRAGAGAVAVAREAGPERFIMNIALTLGRAINGPKRQVPLSLTFKSVNLR